ncbi:MAG: HAMP domain-containing protein [Spirochaetes bacterium]|nr:HAMP domain-containing protein [Spirochaetota bacterium]
MKSRGITSIKTRITLILVLLPLISLAVVGAIAIYENQNSLLSQAQSNLKQLIYEKATGYDYIFERIQQEVQSVSRYAQIVYSAPAPNADLKRRLLLPWTGKGYGNDQIKKEDHTEMLRLQRIGEVLEAVVSNNPYITLGYMGTETGITVFNDEKTVGVIETLKGFEVRKRPWYIKAKQLKKPIWTNLYVDANTKKLTVTCAAPVYNAAGRLVGITGFDVLLDTIRYDIMSMRIGYTGSSFMIDRQGRVIVSSEISRKNTQWNAIYKSDNFLKTQNNEFNRITGRMVNGEAGIESYSTADRKVYYVAYAPITTIISSIGIIVPRGQILKPVEASGKLIIVTLALIIIIALGFGIIISNRITRPIEELTITVDKVSRGLTDVETIPIKRMDEIGTLTKSFNRLMETVSVLMKEKE